jgi:hypothetical protein
MKSSDPAVQELIDRSEAMDAILRFAAGVDKGDRELLHSAFTEDGILDFGPAASALGLQYEPLVIRSTPSRETRLDTTHSITNPRIEINGDVGTMEVLTEAQHLEKGNHSNYLLMKNRYTIELARAGEKWQISRLTLHNVWFVGNPELLNPDRLFPEP